MDANQPAIKPTVIAAPRIEQGSDQPINRKNSKESKTSRGSRSSKSSNYSSVNERVNELQEQVSNLQTSIKDMSEIFGRFQDTFAASIPKGSPIVKPNVGEDGIIFPPVINEEDQAEVNANLKTPQGQRQMYDSFYTRTFPTLKGNPLGNDRRKSVLVAMGKERQPNPKEQPVSETEREERNARNLEKVIESLVGALSGSNPVKFKPQASYEDIKLCTLKVKNVFEFFKKTEEYESRHGVMIPYGMQLDERVRKRICSHNNFIGKDSEFFALSKEEVFMHIQKVIRPRTPRDFAYKLKSALSFDIADKFVLNIETYQMFHIALKTYIKLFKEVFVYLAFQNEEAIPAIDNKTLGVITVFCYGVPFGFATNVCNNLRITTCKEISDFFTKFEAITESLNSLSIEVSKYKSYFIVTKTQDKLFGKYDNEQAEEGTFAKTKGRFGSRNRSSVNRIELDELEDNFDLNLEELTTSDVTMDTDNREIELDFTMDNNDTSMHLDELKSNSIEDNDDMQSLLDQMPPLSVIDDSTTNLNAVPETVPRGSGKLYDPYRKDTATSLVSKNGADTKGSMACFNFMNTGKCDRPNCPYSHSKSVCEERAKYLRDMVAKGAWNKPSFVAKGSSQFAKST